MEKTDNADKKRIVYYLWLTLLLALVFVLSLSLGSVAVSPAEVIKALFSRGQDDTASVIVKSVRLPRVVGALLSGMGLSVSGVILQGVMNNALAGPNTLGVGSGAGFFVMLSLLILPGNTSARPFAAFLGAIAATALIFAFAFLSDASRVTLILAGVAVSSLLSAGMNLIKTIDTDIAINVNSFLQGSLAGVSFKALKLPALGIAIGLIFAVLLSGHLNMLGLGEGVAMSLGLRVSMSRLVLLTVSSLLAGCVTSYAGILSFVGLMVPHICRKLFGNDHRTLVPLSALLGGSFVMICDMLGRVLFSPYEIPTGIIMSFIGGPFFLWLILRGKGGRRINA